MLLSSCSAISLSFEFFVAFSESDGKWNLIEFWYVLWPGKCKKEGNYFFISNSHSIWNKDIWKNLKELRCHLMHIIIVIWCWLLSSVERCKLSERSTGYSRRQHTTLSQLSSFSKSKTSRRTSIDMDGVLQKMELRNWSKGGRGGGRT